MSELDKLDLSLSTLGIEVPKDIMFPDELNKYLRDQIQYLSHENGMLKKNLTDVERAQTAHERTIEQLTKKLHRYEAPIESSSFISVGSIASGKLVELSKKLREKTAELGTSKTRISKLEQVIFEMKREHDAEDKQPIGEIKPKCEVEQELKATKETLVMANKKLFEIKNANTQLNNDMKLANKLLQRELGDSFENMQNLLGANPNWRGRAQIICDLQQKNNEFKEKLKVLNAGTLLTKSEKETRIKNEKRWEQVSQENAQLKADIIEVKRKLDAAKARCRVFDSECATLKAKYAAATEQTDRESTLVTTLSNQLVQFQKTQSDSIKIMDANYQKLLKENTNLLTELEKEKCNTQNTLKTNQELQTEITKLKKCRSNSGITTTKGISEYTHDFPENHTSKTIQILETERLRLLELTQLTSKRLEDERNAHANTHAHFISERQRVARLDAKVARFQLQYGGGGANTDRDHQYTRLAGNSTGCLAGGSRKAAAGRGADNGGGALELQNVRDKLELAEENVKALRTRLQIEQQERKCDLQEFGRILHEKRDLNRGDKGID